MPTRTRAWHATLLLVATALVASAPASEEAGAMPKELTRPRIFITPSDVPRLRAMAGEAKASALGHVPAEGWETIRATADRFLAAPAYHYSVRVPKSGGGYYGTWEYTLSAEAPPRHDESPAYPPWTAMFQEHPSDSITKRLCYLLTAHVVSGDDKYFERARKIVLALCSWQGIWTDPSYGGGKPCLDTGHAAVWVAIFYDWCHDKLSPEQRKIVREGLAAKGVDPIDKMIDGVPAYHNYNAVVSCGLAVGGIALLGEDPRAEGWVAHAIARAKLYLDSQGSDGGAFEGPGYGDYAANAMADLLWALTTAKVPNDLAEHPFIRTLPRYCISLLNPNDWTQPTFGDGGPTRGFGRWMLTIALAGSTDAAWYCQRIGALTPDTPRAFIAVDPARLEPKQPNRNPSDCFVDIGYAILRDGYSSGTAFLAIKAGPP